MASIVLSMVHQNLPIAHYKKYLAERDDRMVFIGHVASWAPQKVERTARTIVNALTQREVGDLVAKEWEFFPPPLRMAITDICDEGGTSNNVRKGIAYLDKRLGGKIRSRATGPTMERKLVAGRNGKARAEQRSINPAVAGAERAFGAFARPRNYGTLSPAEKKRESKKLARLRREAK